LQKRSDDTLDVAIKRFQAYEKTTKPLIEFYKNLNLLKVVNGETSIPQINVEISGLINSNEG
jgi:adenylate kinase